MEAVLRAACSIGLSMGATSKAKVPARVVTDTHAVEVVTIPPMFIARTNHMAQIKGKAYFATFRESILGARQKLADEGASIKQLSAALASIDAALIKEI